MKQLKIACTAKSRAYFFTDRDLVPVTETDFTDVAAVVLTETEQNYAALVEETKFDIPLFIADADPQLNLTQAVEEAASEYEEGLLPPFFKTLSQYVELRNSQFDCPGHQGGQYFRKHPAGRRFFDFFGERIFRSDICNADVALGDLLIHEGPAMEAEKYAAKVYNADKTYFVMNGTSTANTVAVNAVAAPGDLVLFDRNNHKSIYNAALLQSGGIPVYLETARNPYGFIGGIDDHCFEEAYLREKIALIDPERAKDARPFRLAVIQLGTYDGTIYNARQVVDRIGHLCDYILFDSAWVGYEQFIPMMRDCSPLLLELTADDPGILVTQSVHKQQAGFSQSSQIHKKDKHICGQKRYVTHKRFNNSFRLHASTSPLYPIFASLDINARMQDGAAGLRLWADCVRMGIEARKEIMQKCKMIRPFVPPILNGRRWETYPTDEIAADISFFKFQPGEKWHAFEGYGDNQYFVDPNKLLLTTPGINPETGEYENFGIPATIFANYLRENRVVPEKDDLNSILFLLTPAESKEKLITLIEQIVRFEKLVEADAPLDSVLKNICQHNCERYAGYTIRQLCQEMHDFYKRHDAKNYQKQLFRAASFPEQGLSPMEANWELVRNNAKLVPLDKIRGEIALEGALPYPPGIFCVVPGERWNEVAQNYFLLLEKGINAFPGFAPEIQGVYLEEENGQKKSYGYVLDK
jgi:ornithine decarboxylase